MCFQLVTFRGWGESFGEFRLRRPTEGVQADGSQKPARLQTCRGDNKSRHLLHNCVTT